MSGNIMTFPETWEEYEEYYGFNDTEQVYTNGSRLIQSFRVQQWLEHMEQEGAMTFPETVVLCGRCIYNTRNTDSVPEDWCYKHGIDIAYDDYCSYGESVEVEENDKS